MEGTQRSTDLLRILLHDLHSLPRPYCCPVLWVCIWHKGAQCVQLRLLGLQQFLYEVHHLRPHTRMPSRSRAHIPHG